MLQFAGGVGHLTDDSGLIYMRARYYDPASGRFISEDPGRNGTNWYARCGYNPVNAIDASGKIADPLAAIILAAIAAGGAYAGFQVGYGTMVAWIQLQGDPNYNPSMSWLAHAAEQAVTALAAYEFGVRGALWGRGVGAGALIETLGIVGGAAFLAAYCVGAWEAYLDYEDFLRMYEEY